LRWCTGFFFGAQPGKKLVDIVRDSQFSAAISFPSACVFSRRNREIQYCKALIL
jgi:hypothetical protein